MKISDLADLVVVRNHINVVIEAASSVRRNEKGDIDKSEFRALNNARLLLDQKFVEAIRALDFDNLFPNYPSPMDTFISTSGNIEITSDQNLKLTSDSGIKIGSAEYNKDSYQQNLPLNQTNHTITVDTDGVWEDADTTPDHPNDEKAAACLVEAKYKEKANFSAITVKSQDAKENGLRYHEIEKDDTEAAELALIAERVKAQKEQLKKEGRSNKRVSKAKEDGAAK